jgi:hypothetical protein
MKAIRRVGRPPLGETPRQLIAIRVDPGVLDRFREETRRRRIGYQTRINEILARHVGNDVAYSREGEPVARNGRAKTGVAGGRRDRC